MLKKIYTSFKKRIIRYNKYQLNMLSPCKNSNGKPVTSSSLPICNWDGLQKPVALSSNTLSLINMQPGVVYFKLSDAPLPDRFTYKSMRSQTRKEVLEHLLSKTSSTYISSNLPTLSDAITPKRVTLTVSKKTLASLDPSSSLIKVDAILTVNLLVGSARLVYRDIVPIWMERVTSYLKPWTKTSKTLYSSFLTTGFDFLLGLETIVPSTSSSPTQSLERSQSASTVEYSSDGEMPELEKVMLPPSRIATSSRPTMSSLATITDKQLRPLKTSEGPGSPSPPSSTCSIPLPLVRSNATGNRNFGKRKRSTLPPTNIPLNGTPMRPKKNVKLSSDGLLQFPGMKGSTLM